MMSRAQKVVIWCDKSMAFSFYALVYFLPISIALTETFTAIALIFYLVKRASAFYIGVKTGLAWNFLKAFKPVDNCLNRPVALLLAINFFSIFISRYPSVSLEGFLGKTLQSAFLYFNFIECMNSIKRIKIFLTVFFVSGSLICINGLYQYFVGQDFIYGQICDGRISSSLRHSNDFGAYLVVIIPVLLCSLLLTSHRQKGGDVNNSSNSVLFYGIGMKTWIGILLLLSVICLGLTYSRGAWVGFILSLCLLGIRKPKKLWLSWLLVAVFVFIFYPHMMKERNLRNDIKSFFDQSNRLGYWERSSRIIKDYPLLGTGLNTYALVEGAYHVGWGGYPHNSYLQMTAETGLTGISIFMWMIIVLLKNSFRAVKGAKDQSLQLLLLGCLAGLLGFLIHSFFDTNFYSVQLSSFMWLMMGFIVAIQHVAKRQHSSQAQPMPKRYRMDQRL